MASIRIPKNVDRRQIQSLTWEWENIALNETAWQYRTHFSFATRHPAVAIAKLFVATKFSSSSSIQLAAKVKAKVSNMYQLQSLIRQMRLWIFSNICISNAECLITSHNNIVLYVHCSCIFFLLLWLNTEYPANKYWSILSYTVGIESSLIFIIFSCSMHSSIQFFFSIYFLSTKSLKYP